MSTPDKAIHPILDEAKLAEENSRLATSLMDYLLQPGIGETPEIFIKNGGFLKASVEKIEGYEFSLIIDWKFDLQIPVGIRMIDEHATGYVNDLRSTEYVEANRDNLYTEKVIEIGQDNRIMENQSVRIQDEYNTALLTIHKHIHGEAKRGEKPKKKIKEKTTKNG